MRRPKAAFFRAPIDKGKGLAGRGRNDCRDLRAGVGASRMERRAPRGAHLFIHAEQAPHDPVTATLHSRSPTAQPRSQDGCLLCGARGGLRQALRTLPRALGAGGDSCPDRGGSSTSPTANGPTRSPAFWAADYRRARGGRLTGRETKALTELAACRTAALGGHVRECDACGRQEISYNSCRNRHCPKCQGAARAA